MSKYFNEETAHSNMMYWWHGVIQDDKYWSGCTNDDVSNEHSKLHDSGADRNKKGFGKRYKVAIMGRHYAVKSGDDADWLEMAEAVYPVTAGSGLGGSKQTAALRQGAHVIGFYADGKEGREPLILGCFGMHEENEPNIFPGDPPTFFRSRTANKGKCKNEKIKPIATKDRNPTTDNNPKGDPIEANASPLQRSVAHDDKRKDGSVTEPIYPTLKCEGPADILNNIKLLLNKLSYYTNIANDPLSDLAALAEGVIKSVTRAITSLTNTLLDRMRGFVVNIINKAIKDVMNLLPPFLRPDANFKTQGILGALACAFNNIKNKILDVVKDLTKQYIDNSINAGACAATSFLGGLLGNVIGEINGAVDKAVDEIKKVLDIKGITGKALDVLDFILDLLQLFECEKDEAKCPDTTQWSFWNGPKDIPAEIPPAVSQVVEKVINEVETALPSSGGGGGCNSRQVPCGPPVVQITGGGGSGARANAVVSATGAVLGLDFSAIGTNYISEPQIVLADPCGTGGGAVFQPVMRATGTKNEFQEDLFDLIGAIPIDSGTQYLPAPNGTTGGAGFILAGPSDTILFKTGSTQIINGKEVKGTGYEVYKCGTTFRVLKEDEVYLPPATTADVFDQDGIAVQTLNGLGQLTPLVIENSGTLTAPCNPDNVTIKPIIDFPLSSGETGIGTTASVGIATTVAVGIATTVGGVPVGIASTSKPKPDSYQVVPEIEDIFIKNPGFGYLPTDQIEILNNKGAELEFDVNEQGQVTKIRVINGGLGFHSVPDIRIDSQTGYNFEAVAVFKFTPLSEIDLNNITPPPGARVVNVVDCVGKIPPRTQFNINPSR